MQNLLLDISTGTIDWARAQFALTAIWAAALLGVAVRYVICGF